MKNSGALQGVVICLLSSAGQQVRAIIAVSMRGACLELSRMDGARHRSHVASLRDALEKLPELAATHSHPRLKQPPVYRVHADSGSLFVAHAIVTERPVQERLHQQHALALQRAHSPVSRVAAVRSNRVVPLDAEEDSEMVSEEPSYSLQLALPASNVNAQPTAQPQDNANRTETLSAAQQHVESPHRARTATQECTPVASPCRSPCARVSRAEENQHISNSLQLIRRAKGPDELCVGLKQMKVDRIRAAPGWADEWISYEALEVSSAASFP